MSLSSKEAAASLSQVEQASRRSSQLYIYHRSSPHLIMWGIIWIVGYGGTGLFPHYANPLWAVLILVGCAGGTLLAWQRRPDGIMTSAPGVLSPGPQAWRFAAMWAIILFFVFATYAIMQPHLGKQFAAYPALITGSVYMAIGLWRGLRYVISGMVVAALTLVGFFYIEPIFLWFAVVGGGAMILTGIWFRTV